MDKQIQKKIEDYKKLAGSGQKVSPREAIKGAADSLSKVIRSKKEADQFMAELNGITGRAK